MGPIEMTAPKHLPADDLERLSAYIDGELSPVETAELEARLSHEPDLRAALLDLRSVVKATRSIPPRRLPRSFTLTPEMVGARGGFRFPVLQLASAVTALAFVVLFGFDLLGASFSGMRAASPAGEVQMLEAPAEEVPALPPEAAQPAPEEPMLGAAAQATEEPLLGGGQEATPSMLEQEAPAAGETGLEGEAMKFAATPVTTEAAEFRSAADEALAASAPTATPAALTATGITPESIPSEVENAAHAPPAQPGLSVLRIGEITLASLSVLFAVLSLLLRRKPG
jgi:hypothetical protein